MAVKPEYRSNQGLRHSQVRTWSPDDWLSYTWLCLERLWPVVCDYCLFWLQSGSVRCEKFSWEIFVLRWKLWPAGRAGRIVTYGGHVMPCHTALPLHTNPPSGWNQTTIKINPTTSPSFSLCDTQKVAVSNNTEARLSGACPALHTAVWAATLLPFKWSHSVTTNFHISIIEKFQRTRVIKIDGLLPPWEL